MTLENDDIAILWFLFAGIIITGIGIFVVVRFLKKSTSDQK
jgi:predicted permease